ncbi:putative RNA methyltransferase [Bacillus sp. N9]
MSQLSRKALAGRRLEKYAHFFRCPLCHHSMSFDNQSLICAEGHRYDLAKRAIYICWRNRFKRNMIKNYFSHAEE